MESAEQRERVEGLEGYFILGERPERIRDQGLLERALDLIKKTAACTGQEYVFTLIQQSNIGSYIDFVPKEYMPNVKVNLVLRVYDGNFFVDRLGF